MAKNGYYDKNKDYSLEIRRAQERGASQAELSRLREERQNKIDSRYGGRDPYRGRADIMGTGSRDRLWKETPAVHTRPGGAKPAVKNTTLLGGRGYENKRVALGDWTYIFNHKGRQVGRVKDYGASANGVIHTAHADDSPAHRAAYDAAARGDWDAVGHWLGKISEQGGRNAYGTYDMTEANRYGEELQMEFPGSIRSFYRNKYDGVYGPGAWDDPNHSAANPEIDPAYRELAESGRFLPARPAGSVSRLPAGSGFRPGGYDRAAETLEELYRRRAKAEEARLRALYREQADSLEAHDDLLSRLYADKRNQAAARSEQERLRLMELGLAQGLNTGAAGQLAAGQSAAYQGVLGGLDRQESADRAETGRKLDALWSKYQAQVQAGNADLAGRYYDDLRRREEQRIREEEARRRQADALAQRQWEQERWEREWAAKQEAEQWKQEMKRAEMMARWGDFSGYRALGMMK